MARKCIVDGCESKSGDPQHQGVTFHSFPFDSKTREIWLVNTRINPEKNITKSVLVCSRHFRRVDFQPSKSNKYFLKPGAIPTIFPWGELPHTEVTSTGQSDGSQMEEDSERSITSDNSSQQDSYRDSPVPGTSFVAGSKRPSIGTVQTENVVGQSDTNPQTPKQITPTDNSLQTSSQVGEMQINIASQLDADVPKKPEPVKMNSFTAGETIEALDYDGMWHPARVIEVDNDEKEILIRIDKSGKSKTPNGIEEWIAMNSSRLRERQTQPTPSKGCQIYALGERVIARWTGNRRFPATINKVFGNDTYEVLFDDGFVKTVKANYITKMKTPQETTTPVEKKLTQTGKTSASKAAAKKDWPLISMSSLNLEELNLPVIPTDGEWCCHWVNDQPIGREGFLTVGDHKKPTVIVDDWRLPPNWTKHMYQRSNILGKWDVILVNPAGKRFRSKADLKVYIEELGQTYNPDVYDFSIHRRRAKDIGAYVYTKEYKAARNAAAAAEKQAQAAAATASPVPTSTPVLSSSQPDTVTPNVIKQIIQQQASISSPAMLKEEATTLEDGYVYVGSVKVQIVDNLFRCPQEGCNKNFRKENHLQIHIKHYHEEIAKLLGVFPNMQELAYKRTIGQPTDDPVPKNHLPNAQFFAKLHQQDLQTKHHRKSHTASLSEIPSPVSTVVQLNPPEILAKPVEEQLVKVDIETKPSPVIAAPAPENIALEVATTPIKEVPHMTGGLPNKEEIKPVATKRKAESTGRKSGRQRLTKKYLESTPTGTFDNSFTMNDLEETRHSFNATPEVKPAKKPKLHHSLTTDGFDGNSHTTGSFIDHSQSPQYINENGEIIKIVRMRQEEIINCLCSFAEEDGLMIQCELCLCWQHGICNGIEKQSQVPEKYICYICRNPQRGRQSLKYIHDQDWLYEGKLPVANYHAQNPAAEDRFNILRKTHTLSGNLLELKRFMHSLKVKINIAENKDHPKMYLWAKKWETASPKELKAHVKQENDFSLEIKQEGISGDMKIKHEPANDEQIKTEEVEHGKHDMNYNPPTIPQPEKAIDPIECQHRLLEHIQQQQACVMDRLQAIEAQVMELEATDNSLSADSDDSLKAEKTLSMLIKDLEVMRNIAKINTVQTNNLVPL